MKLFLENKEGVNQLAMAIKKRVLAHRELYSNAIKAELWEEVLHRSFADIGITTDWQPDGNHGVGKDMTLATGERISCKSGSYDNKGTLTISGSRLTKHKTLQEKISFISDKKEDSYALLSRHKNDKRGAEYKLILFPSDILNYGELDWKIKKTKPKKNSGLTSQPSGFEASSSLLICSIQKNMSDQLWTKIRNFEDCTEIVHHTI